MHYDYSYADRLLTVEGLALNINGKQILRNLNLAIDNVVRSGMAQGQVVSILGPSGIGKTQLFRCLAGLQKPTLGFVGLGPTKHPVAAGQVGVVFQNYPLMIHRSVKQNLLMAASHAMKTEKDMLDLVNLFDLVDKLDCYPAQLSGGQRQRISIIQQLLCSDHFILMDEPFSGLDVVSKQKMIDLILQVSTVDELSTIVVTTHDIETAIAISDHIWVLGRERLSDGTIVPGATLIKTIDLIALDLAWHKDVRHEANFRLTYDNLYNMFKTL
jgi:ABC-type nitrate/sulfonate/bicarbonate transport system ATPase subunit